MNKSLLPAFNFILTICGTIILIVGVFFRIRGNASAGVATGVPARANMTMIIGGIVLAISLCGAWAMGRQKRRLIMIYACFLTMIMCIQMGLGIAALTQCESDTEAFERHYSRIFKHYWSHGLVSDAVDNVQVSLFCCGVESEKDFLTIGDVIPGTCCGKLRLETCTDYNVYQKGCRNALTALIISSYSVSGAIAVALSVFYLFGIVIALAKVKTMSNAQSG